MRRTATALVTVLSAAALGLAACGDNESDANTARNPAGQSEGEVLTDGAMQPGMGAETPSDAMGFLQMAAVSNMFEIESSRLAKEKNQPAPITEFADMMITDHTRAGQDMQAAVSEAGLNFTMPTSLDAEHMQKMNDLRGLNGEDFGDRYLDIQTEAHERAVALFQNYAQNGDNPRLKQFAATTLPALQRHLDRVRQLDDREANEAGAAGTN
ncbi:DUF4142 domain-containing protein [Brevundimonas sp. 2R-24]|uniref:DUF4142 domain-containing protein n=1 Tax=Peiella sedimenti TaxID=3061083 RepID=A0ABT8SPU8_9CAUL|nr:DUF4142 domain-containing protein [Caulobacteraceae bacterium XZ-24]